MTVCHHNGVSLSSGRTSAGRLALHCSSWPRLFSVLGLDDLPAAAWDEEVIPARGFSFLAAEHVYFTLPLLLRYPIRGQMGFFPLNASSKWRFWLPHSRDLGTISPNVPDMSHAEGKSPQTSFTGMSEGLESTHTPTQTHVYICRFLLSPTFSHDRRWRQVNQGWWLATTWC